MARSEEVEESRIAVIKAWTHPQSGEVLCKISSSSDASSEAAEEAMEVEDPRGPSAERAHPAREPQAPDHARGEQRPGDDA